MKQKIWRHFTKPTTLAFRAILTNKRLLIRICILSSKKCLPFHPLRPNCKANMRLVNRILWLRDSQSRKSLSSNALLAGSAKEKFYQTSLVRWPPRSITTVRASSWSSLLHLDLRWRKGIIVVHRLVSPPSHCNTQWNQYCLRSSSRRWSRDNRVIQLRG